MRRLGTVVAVQVTTAGSYVTADTAAGATLLPIDDMGDFPEDGGTVLLGGTVEVSYDSATDDDAGDYLTLTDPLADGVSALTSADVSPIVQAKTALVDIGGGEVYACDIPSGHLWSDARLAEGSTSGQTVWVESGRNGAWSVVGIPGSAPTPDLSFGADGSLPLSRVIDRSDAEDSNVGADLLRLSDLRNVDMVGSRRVFDDGAGNRIVADDSRGTREVYRDGVLVESSAAGFTVRRGIDQLGVRDASVDGVADLRGQVWHSPGSTERYLSQVSAPPAPVASASWPSVLTTPPGDVGNTSVTYLASTDRFYYTRSVTGSGKAPTLLLQLWSFPSAGGAATLEWEQPLQALSLTYGICKVGPSWFNAVRTVPGLSAASVQERDASGVLLNQWDVTPVPGETEFTIGTDGTNILVMWSLFSSSMDIQTYSTAGVLSSTLTCTGAGGNARFVGKGTYDFGATRIVVGGSVGSPVVFDTSGTQHTDEEWETASFILRPLRLATGIAWNSTDGYWVELCSDGTVFRYTDAEWDAGVDVDVPYSALVTLRDGSGHETEYEATAVASFNMQARQEITVYAPAIPPGATMYALYLARVSSPTRTDFYLQGTPATGDQSWVIDSPTFSGAHPPASNNFPAGTSLTYSADGSLIADWSAYSHAHDLPYRVTALEAGGGGGGGTGGVDIDCGNASASGVEIDCGAA